MDIGTTSADLTAALTVQAARANQANDLAVMKQALVQDAAALQVVSAASQPSAPIMPTHNGLGQSLNILV